MTFFFDANLSPKLAKVLAALGIDAHHHDDVFGPATEDVDIIRVVAARGWVYVSADTSVRKNPAERTALVESGIRAVFLSKTILHLRPHQQVSIITGRLDELLEKVRRLPEGGYLIHLLRR